MERIQPQMPVRSRDTHVFETLRTPGSILQSRSARPGADAAIPPTKSPPQMCFCLSGNQKQNFATTLGSQFSSKAAPGCSKRVEEDESSATSRVVPAAGAYPPEASGTLLLVDVDEAANHATLEQTALSLHSNLKETRESAGQHQRRPRRAEIPAQ